MIEGESAGRAPGGLTTPDRSPTCPLLFCHRDGRLFGVRADVTRALIPVRPGLGSFLQPARGIPICGRAWVPVFDVTAEHAKPPDRKL